MSSGRRRAAGADSGAVNANSRAASSAGSSADSSRATPSVYEEARVEESRRRGGEVASRRDKEMERRWSGEPAREPQAGRTNNYAMHIWEYNMFTASGAVSLDGTSSRCQSMIFDINGSGTKTCYFRIYV